MKGMGVFATKEEIAEIKKAAERANGTPCIAFSVADGINHGGLAGRAH